MVHFHLFCAWGIIEKPSLFISLGLSLKEKIGMKIKTNKKSYTGTESIARINNYIQKKKAEAMEIIVKLWESGELDTLSINALKNYIIKPNDQSSFYQFTEHLIIDLKSPIALAQLILTNKH
ncbi:MAG: hypothetical protein IPN13_16935 [Bacteroidetes bacterium]|nr:hypothetical protein [Bacteroidota bacterium]